jgi:hypothetical protein
MPGHVADTIRQLGSATSKRKNVNAVLTHDKGPLLVGRDGEGTVYFAHVPFQVSREDRMDIDHHDPEFMGPHVLLMREIGVEGHENTKLLFSGRKELVIIVVFPPLILGRCHLVSSRKLGT